MLTDQRHRIIRDELTARGSVVAGDLAQRFGVSEDTIRRDLRDLAKGGECRRVYGGAVAAAPYAGALSDRTRHGGEAKARLARAAVALLAPRQTVFIDSGSTNIAIARAVPQDAELTVATNAIDVAAALSAHPRIELIVLGGAFDREAGACTGASTLHGIAQISADLFFLGSCGVDPARGVTAFVSAEAEVKRAMAAASAGVVIAATSEKLGTAAPFRVAAPEAIRHLVVESEAPPDLIAGFERLGAAIHRA